MDRRDDTAGRPSLRWEDDDGGARGGPGAPPGHRRRVLVAATAAVAVGLAVVAAVAAVRAGPASPAPDRYALDQVGLRYRALGPDLLDGALRCAPTTPRPGRTETLDCTFGAWSIVLAGYGSRADLDAARAEALAPAAGSVRHAQAVEDGAAFAMDETAAGTTVYWDASVPRPVSATVTADALPLPDLLDFYDSRGARLLTRPEQPGPAFRSGVLWALARSRVLTGDPSCAPLPEATTSVTDLVEQVRCTYPDGTIVGFTRLRDLTVAERFRAVYLDAEGTVAGTLRVGAWAATDDPGRAGALVEYVYDFDGDARLYFDDLDTFCFGLVVHPDLTQDQLKAFWSAGGYREVGSGGGLR